MKIVIAGTRTIMDPSLVAAAVAASGFTITEVVSGTARGADQLGEAWGRAQGVPVVRFPAEWERFGRRAGILRNQAMIDYVAPSGGGLIALWDGVSRGTQHVINYARQRGVPLYVHRVRGCG